MAFLKRLFGRLRQAAGENSRRTLPVYVLSHRCQEPLKAEVDLLNALSLSDEPDAAYYTRKVIEGSGARRCFARVEVELWFDGQRRLLRHKVHGGRWLTAEEYAVERERFLRPPTAEAEDGEGGAEEGPGAADRPSEPSG